MVIPGATFIPESRVFRPKGHDHAQIIDVCLIKFHSKHSIVLALFLLRNLMEQKL